jgi:hypothetical protein
MRLPTTARPQQQPPCQRALLQLQQRHGRAPLTSTTKHPRPLNTKPPLPCNPSSSSLPWRAPLGAAQHLKRPHGTRAPLQLQQRIPTPTPLNSTTKPPNKKPPRSTQTVQVACLNLILGLLFVGSNGPHPGCCPPQMSATSRLDISACTQPPMACRCLFLGNRRSCSRSAKHFCPLLLRKNFC